MERAINMALGVCYYPEHWPEAWWRDDARRMRELGITYVRIGEFAWSRIEPARDHFEWDWLDRAINVLGEAGLKIVLGTPTATPPKWLIDEFPDIVPTDAEGRPRGFGSRRHYSFSSYDYWRESARIVKKIAERYGEHPALVGWQTDNEYGCHDTILSYGKEDLKAFREWLRMRYQAPEQLNEAWGNVFWSMEVKSFSEISLPNLTVTEANPAARLDFWRFQSSQVEAYNRMQCDLIRAFSPDRWITHNYMGFFNEFDHWPLGNSLDLASWDSYPIGFVERFPFSEIERNRWAETSHPDIAPFHHDLYRGVGRGRFWVMEQQPGPVNWAPWNPEPKPGMVRLWTWEALAHGAETVSYFRWRQATAAQEQMHAGLNLAGLHELSLGGREAKQVAEELKAIGPLPATQKARVALVYDYEASWITRIQPQGADYSFVDIMFRWYEAARRLGLDIDVVPPGAPLDDYALILVPCLPYVSDAAARAFDNAKGVILLGPRTGSKTRDFKIPDGLPPGPLSKLLGFRVLAVSSARPGLVSHVRGALNGTIRKWRERVECHADAKVLAQFDNDAPAIMQNNNAISLLGWPDEDLLTGVMRYAARGATLDFQPVPDSVRLRRRGNLIFAFNYGDMPWPPPDFGARILGTGDVGAQDLAIWRDG
ncbi:MAG: beta-galactosidase [Alphaproteobacteria bacterium]